MSKKFLPHIIILILSLTLSYAYFSPLLNGKKLVGHDDKTAAGGSQEIKTYYQEEGEVSKWTNSMFGGMPAYTIWGKDFNPIKSVKRGLESIGHYPVSIMILIFLGAYLCLILFGISPWLSIIGALLYGFASYYYILIGAGHVTKVLSLAYMSPLIAAIYYTYNKSAIKGGVLTGLLLAFQIGSSHPQIVYYTLIAVLLFAVAFFIDKIRTGSLNETLKPTLILVLAAVLAVGTNSSYLLTMKEYSTYSTRGQNELTKDNNTGETGLDKDYILDYSYDFTEAFTAFIPRLKGGSMAEPLSENSNLYKEFEKRQGKQQAKKTVEGIPLYWGSQPIVSGPFYFGAITLFLFVLGLFVIKGYRKWWLLSVVIISFLLSLGKYFPSLSHFAIDYIPLYNKFRDVKNIIFIQNFAMWLIGFMALGEMLLKKDTLQKEYLKALKLSTIIAGGFTLLFAIIPSLAGSFTGSVDAQLAGSGWTESLLSKLRSDRIAIARMDALRSTLFIVLAAGLVWVYLKGKIKNQYILIIASVVILADLWPTNKRYLNNDDFTSKRKAEVAYTATKADQAILQDKSLDYRVLNMSVNPWSDASTSFYHKSIGGYAGAKMQRYQDMIEYHLSPELQKLGGKLRTVKSQADVDQLFVGLNGLNMLNTKYTIYNPNAAPLQNTSAMGNAWFVNDVVIVADANEEIDKIDEVDISNLAIVDKRFENLLPTNTSSDPTALISLESYAPNKLVYRTSSQQEQIAVFSEIYYPKGWIAFIDGEEASHFRANYILRSMVVPAGEHEVVFEFKPQSYEIGNKVSFASSLILLLAAAGVVFIEIRKKRLQPKDEE